MKRLEPGDNLAGRFRLVQPLGQGSIGEVWLARDGSLNRAPVVCKILRAELAEDRAFLSDLKREVLLTRRLRHPAIVGVYTFWEAEPWRFITMEYVDGENLRDALAAHGGPFSPREVLPWLKSLSEALDYAHEEGILHCGVKPGNMMLRKDGKARLGDFGIAEAAHEFQSRVSGRQTQETLLFMSPEQVMGETLDLRSDVYSLACSMYELLSGKPPFHRGAIVTQIQVKPAPAIDGLPDAVNDVLLKALAKTPEDRHPTCGAFYKSYATAVSLVADRRKARTGADVVASRDESEAPTPAMAGAEMQSTRLRLGQLLVESGVLTKAQLDDALRRQSQSGTPLGAVLVGLGVTTETVIAQTVAQQLALPYRASVLKLVRKDVAALVSHEFAKGRCCLPLRRTRGRLEVAMANPLDIGALNTVEAAAHERAEIVVTTSAAVLEAVRRAFNATT